MSDTSIIETDSSKQTTWSWISEEAKAVRRAKYLLKTPEQRLKDWHTVRHSFDPIYMDDKFREFNIRQDPETRKWRIVGYKKWLPVKELKGLFTSFGSAEKTLVNWIKRNNKGHARYPGCPKPRPTSSTEHFLKDWSPRQAL